MSMTLNSIIYKIGLFSKINQDQSECLDCKAKGREKFIFVTSKNSVKSLCWHLFSKLHDKSEYADKYRKLKTSQNETKQAKIFDLMQKSTNADSLSIKVKMSTNDGVPSTSRCSSRIRHRNGTVQQGRHRSANSALKRHHEKDYGSNDPKNGKKLRSSNLIKQSIQQKEKEHKMDLADSDDDNVINKINNTNFTVVANSAKSMMASNNNAVTKQMRNRRRSPIAMGEGTSSSKWITKNGLELPLILFENEGEEENVGLINYIANLVEFKLNNPQYMDFIDKNFPNFRAANPELTIKLFVLLFLNICADINENEEKKEEWKTLMEIGKKVKELLAEIGENMAAAKFEKLSCEVERALSLIFSNSIEELDDHHIRQNRQQFAETVKNALKEAI